MKWLHHLVGLAGEEEEVTTFLSKRLALVKKLGIIEIKLQFSSDIAKTIFASSYFNQGLKKWINDWNEEAYVQYDAKELYGDVIKYPSTRGPSDLLSALSNLEEPDRYQVIRYKGKISPEGWVHR
ncbi:unnamed protein product [Psylliodes chrysocephalus]|uniref:Uncharacterized protein n=1 Tax=Psylliodes chrysocephalus TaxID=3402493 RepID=A0A9P0GEI4_9CUCU|nr:unnamed protein product [Psylliodes chrysocephala]